MVCLTSLSGFLRGSKPRASSPASSAVDGVEEPAVYSASACFVPPALTLDTVYRHNALFCPRGFLQEDDWHLDSDWQPLPTEVPQFPLDDIFGHRAKTINGYLYFLWYTSVNISVHERGPLCDRRSSWFAGFEFPLYSHLKPTGQHVGLKFDKPTITPLCAREVILRFTLSESEVTE